MRTALLASLLAFAPFAAPAHAAPADLSTITCSQLAEMDEDGISFMLIWVDGWLAGKADDTTMDPEVLDQQVSDIAAHCDANPDLSVMNAAKAVTEK